MRKGDVTVSPRRRKEARQESNLFGFLFDPFHHLSFQIIPCLLPCWRVDCSLCYCKVYKAPAGDQALFEAVEIIL